MTSLSSRRRRRRVCKIGAFGPSPGHAFTYVRSDVQMDRFAPFQGARDSLRTALRVLLVEETRLDIIYAKKV